LDATRRLKLLELQAKQRQRRAKIGNFQAMEGDELRAIKNLALRLFGNSRESYTSREYGTRYGALIEAGPEEPGIVYIGFFIDPPTVMPAKRRRKLLFYGAKVSELEEQARLVGFSV
jgi:hypothetical protein